MSSKDGLVNLLVLLLLVLLLLLLLLQAVQVHELHLDLLYLFQAHPRRKQLCQFGQIHLSQASDILLECDNFLEAFRTPFLRLERGVALTKTAESMAVVVVDVMMVVLGMVVEIVVVQEVFS